MQKIFKFLNSRQNFSKRCWHFAVSFSGTPRLRAIQRHLTHPYMLPKTAILVRYHAKNIQIFKLPPKFFQKVLAFCRQFFWDPQAQGYPTTPHSSLYVAKNGYFGEVSCKKYSNF